MKRILSFVAILACIVTGSAAYAIQVTVDGSPINFDQAPIMSNGRVLVPLRGVFERLGATVNYNASNRSITATRGTTQVSLSIGNPMAMVNGQNQQLDSAPIEMGGRALVPLRFVSEALGADVKWNTASQLVAITSGNQANNGIPPVYQPPAYQPPPVYNTLAITSITTRPAGQINAGQQLRATMYGTAGGQATFDVGRRTGNPMTEGPAGTYHGTYTVRNQDNDSNALITGHLTMPDGRQTSMNGQQTVALFGNGNNNNNNNNNNGRLINSVIHNGNGTLRFGQTLTVTMSAQSQAIGTFDVGNHRGIAMTETSPGNYVGTFTLALGDVQPNATVIANLRTHNGQIANLVATPTVSLLGLP